jgi:hypothetical protein
MEVAKGAHSRRSVWLAMSWRCRHYRSRTGRSAATNCHATLAHAEFRVGPVLGTFQRGRKRMEAVMSVDDSKQEHTIRAGEQGAR